MDDDRDVDVPLPACRILPRRRGGVPDKRIEVRLRDPVLLADPDRSEPPVTYVVADRPDMQAETIGDLLDRVQLVRNLWHIL
jgi:hypothetical protein